MINYKRKSLYSGNYDDRVSTKSMLERSVLQILDKNFFGNERDLNHQPSSLKVLPLHSELLRTLEKRVKNC